MEQAFARGWIGPWVMNFGDFKDDLEKRLADDDPLAVFARNNMGPITDAAALFASWNSFGPEPAQCSETLPPRSESAPRIDAGVLWQPQRPVVNPLRHVSRDDPCPCDSGKKYKKCCLGTAA